MKFLMINAVERTAQVEDYRNLVMAQQALGLDPGAVDHGTVQRGLAYVVFEYGLFVPADKQHYFAIGNRLISGNCVVYAYDEAGETVDISTHAAHLPISFFHSTATIERAIEQGIVVRPEISVNGKRLWCWPDPPPSEFGFPLA